MIIGKRLYIFGAGGLAIDTYNVMLENNESLEGFIDEINFNRKLFDVPVYSHLPDNKSVVIAVGNPSAKQAVVAKLKTGTMFESVIQKDVFISKIVSLGVGNIIMKNTTISGNVKLGSHVCVNSQSTVSHDSVVDDYCTITPGVTICGNVKIGKRCWIGAGTTIKENINIADDVFIGAGSLVLKDITEPGLYFGHPAKKR